MTTEEERHDELMDAISTLNITFCRVYDAAMAILSKIDDDLAESLAASHEDGLFISSAPNLASNPFPPYTEEPKEPLEGPTRPLE
jgi:hypothetical protein